MNGISVMALVHFLHQLPPHTLFKMNKKWHISLCSSILHQYSLIYFNNIYFKIQNLTCKRMI